MKKAKATRRDKGEHSAEVTPIGSGGAGAFVLECHQRLLDLDPAVRAGNGTDDLHQMRVTVRRLRAVLRAVDPHVGLELGQLRAGLAWIGDYLGAVRDLDVLEERLVERLPDRETSTLKGLAILLAQLESERQAVRGELLKAMSRLQYFELLDSLAAVGRKLSRIQPDKPLSYLAAKEFRALKKYVKKRDRDLSERQVHRLRIRTKRVRYLTEIIWPQDENVEAFVDQAKRVQDICGTNQDSVVMEAWLTRLAEDDLQSKAAFLSGRLVSREQQIRIDYRQELLPEWKRLRKLGERVWARL